MAEKTQALPCEIVKRSVMISGHASSVTLEAVFWQQLKALAQDSAISVNALVSQIDAQNNGACNLSSAIRVYILNTALGANTA